MIDLNDLRHSIDRALNLGRYTIVVKTAGGEQVPASITLDLLERDDDLFDTGYPEGMPAWDRWAKAASEEAVRPTITPEGDALVDTVTDDHGPAIPAQDAVYPSPFDKHPRIYEFALQDADTRFTTPYTLEQVDLVHAPDVQAVNHADWVHVYDRVTRERRTLKRPEPDAVLAGLRDVAADLRRQAFEGSDPSKPYDGSGMVEGLADLSSLIFTRGGVPVEDQKAGLEEFKAAALKPDPMPPVGPLTSTEGLKAGDVLRALWGDPDNRRPKKDETVRFVTAYDRDHFTVSDYESPCRFNRFSFVARPGVWMPWEGGETPIPGLTGVMRLKNGGEYPLDAGARWDHNGLDGDIVAYMVVDTPSASSDT